MERKDWTLLALAAAKGEPLSPVQLQKSLFLLGKVHARRVGRRFYTFQPYHYGPFDQSIYEDAEQLARDGLAVVTMAPHGRWSEYRASAEGVARSKAVRAEAPNAAVEYLERAVEWCRSLSFQQLVRAIYAKYPEFRQNSVFR
jgi:hypothetical protein